MAHRHRFAPFRPFVALLVAVVLGVVPLVSAAQVASPEASPASVGSWVGQEPDLAAMPVTPADLEAMGLPGFLKFDNGNYLSFDAFAEFDAGFFRKPLEEARALYERVGWSRFYGSGLGIPSVPDEDGLAERVVFTNIHEFADAAGADEYLTHTSEPGSEGEGPNFQYAEAPFTVGDRTVVFQVWDYFLDAALTTVELNVYFQRDNLVVNCGFWVGIPDPEGTPGASPEASPVASPEVPPAVVGSVLDSPAATISEVETLCQRTLERIDAVVAGGAPNLGSLVRRVGHDPQAEADYYTEGYRLLDDELRTYYPGYEDDILADPAAVTGADAVYELVEFFRRGEEDADTDAFFLNRLYQFPDEATAEAFMVSRPDVLPTGGFTLATDATDEARNELLPGEATDIGDESLAFDFARSFDNGEERHLHEGYEIYVRVGAMVAAVSLEGPPDMPLSEVEALAEAQAACLQAGECPDALPVPESFRAPLPAMGTPEAATPAA